MADPTNVTGVFGAIFFRQCKRKELFVGAYVGGLTEGSHGFHVHTDGITGGVCSSAGGHYNPTGVTHSSWDANSRHDGDLQSLVSTDQNSFTLLEYYDPQATLFGDRSILGRGIVVHADADDLGLGGDSGSLANGNAGPRVACCTITEVLQ